MCTLSPSKEGVAEKPPGFGARGRHSPLIMIKIAVYCRFKKDIQKTMNENKKTILLVEDEPILGMITKKQLEEEGYSVVIAINGEKAIEVMCAEKAPIDLILMDINLGKGMDGTEAAQEILKNHDIPLLFLSSHTEKDIVESTEKITNYGYVVKNSSITVLDASIKMAFKLFTAKKTAIEKELALVRSEEKYRLISENTSDGIVHFSAEGIIDYVSPSYLQQLGYSEQEELGKKYASIAPEIHPEDRDILFSSIHNAIEHKKNKLTYSYRVKHARGHYIWREDHSSFVYDASGRYLGAYVTCRDITERTNDAMVSKTAEAALIESEKKYRTLHESLMDAYVSIDMNGMIIETNMLFQKLLGFSEEELRGMDNSKFSLPEWNEYERTVVLKQLLKYGYSDVYQKEYIRKDGTKFPAELRVSMLRDSTGKPVQMWATVRDITERKQKEDELQKNENMLKAIIENAPFAIWGRDVNFIGILENTRSIKSIGSIIGKVPQDNPSYADLWEKNNSRVLNGELIFEEHFYEKDRQKQCLLQIIFPIFVHNAIIAIAGFNLDITDRKITEEKIKNLIIEKELILKETHHRIKNNMNIISALLKLQSDTQTNPETTSILQDAFSRVQGMMVLYDKLYQSENHQQVSLKEYVPSLVHEIVQIFPQKEFVKIKTHIEDITLGERILSPLGIIINELITNSMKYAFRGRSDGLITIHASAKENLVTLTYQDDGVGMPESISFENSTGFGILLIKGLITQIHGSIRIDQKSGTKFVIEFEE